MHTEIHKYTRFGLIKYNGITGYFVDFLGQRLCTYGFPKLGFDNFPISCPKFHWIIPIVMLKFGLYMKKLSEAVKIFKVELRLIVKASDGNLPDIIRDFKRYTNIKLIERIKENPESRREWLIKKFEYAAKRIKRNNQYKIWKDGYHPVELTDNYIIDQRLRYIHNNPVEEEVVVNPEDFKYSSAGFYAGMPGLLTIEKLH